MRQIEQAIAKQIKRATFSKKTVDESKVGPHNTPHLLQSRLVKAT